MENLEELASLKIQVEYLRLQDKLGKQNVHEVMKNLYEPLTDTVKGTSPDITKRMTEISIKNIKVLENLNNKLLEIMKVRGVMASFLISPFI